ncbi:MAG: thioredoxin domain-containing protein [Smithellaceae bacterium]
MKQNRLKSEKSPYLLQHAQNPVDWYPWGEEAFEKSRRADQPIFLSIGYSTCHWCHVMERESFEDEKVAQLLNEVFVCIKVDREERPDIDNIYMTVCQMMTQSGGWPLTILMTPDKKPFFAATYIPRETMYGRIGMLDLIPEIRKVWTTQRQEVINAANKITQELTDLHIKVPTQKLGEDTLSKAFEYFIHSFDRRYGGFGNAPKFPTPHNLYFLMRYWKRKNESAALKMVEETLQHMRRGGIYDQIGFGFHRYSTDAEWLVPHFEKMLYDQALMAMAYIEAYQATGKKDYEDTAREIFTYVLRDMTGTDGGFYSAEDADSEGMEGKFYLWAEEEIYNILKKDDADLFLAVFKAENSAAASIIAEQGLAGYFIPHLESSLNEIAQQLNISEEKLTGQLNEIRKNLLASRDKRIHPFKDDKILTDWNGLMVAALARGAQVFNEPVFADTARRAIDFILNRMRTSEGRLLHRFRDGIASIPATVDDYAFIIWGLLELYEATFEIGHLDTALMLNKQILDHFWDKKDGGFYFTPDDGEELLVHRKEAHDSAIPAGNSVSMLNLLRLARITGNTELESMSAAIGKMFSAKVVQFPSAYTQLLVALDFVLGPSSEVVIAGDLTKRDTKEMVKALRAVFAPNKVVLFRPVDETLPEIEKIAPFLKSQLSIDGKATAYVCSNYSCQSPTNSIDKMIALLKSGSG